MNAEDSNSKLSWLIQNLVDRVPHARSALLLAKDGLKMARTSDLATDTADQMAAIASGLFSLASAAGLQFTGKPGARQVVVEMEGLWLYVASAGFGTCISVLADEKADSNQIGYEMVQLVRSMREHLAIATRDRAVAAAAAVPRAES